MKQTSAGLWIPNHLKGGQRRIAVVFWRNIKFNRIVVGCPEAWPAPKGYEKIVCRSAVEVQKWSDKMRDQDRRDAEMTAAEREAIEGPIREYARKELIHKMLNAKDQKNRDFCRWALDKMDEDEKKKKNVMGERISYQHSEAFEEGH